MHQTKEHEHGQYRNPLHSIKCPITGMPEWTLLASTGVHFSKDTFISRTKPYAGSYSVELQVSLAADGKGYSYSHITPCVC